MVHLGAIEKCSMVFSTSLSSRFSSCQTFLASHFRTDWLSQMELGNQVGSTNDHLANRYLPSTPKDGSTIRAELTEEKCTMLNADRKQESRLEKLLGKSRYLERISLSLNQISWDWSPAHSARNLLLFRNRLNHWGPHCSQKSLLG